MKSTTFPFLLALGLTAQPVLAAGDAGARPDATSGYGLTSGGPAGMRSEAGFGMSGGADQQMPQPQTSGDITYLCGGIGESEANYMQQQARDYDMKLSFAAASGAYLAGVDVDIRGPQGDSILQVSCDGPLLLVDVPQSGTYRIVADAEGFQQTRTVRVNDANRTAANVALTWPRDAVAQMEQEAAAPATGGSGISAGAAGSRAAD